MLSSACALQALTLLVFSESQATVRCVYVCSSRVDCALTGGFQQHGSVYWSEDAERLLASLDCSRPLAEQLAPEAFSIPRAPIWQDSSTTRECRELEQAIGGAQALADLTGSRAYERFTANQIARVRVSDLHFSSKILGPPYATEV